MSGSSTAETVICVGAESSSWIVSGSAVRITSGAVSSSSIVIVPVPTTVRAGVEPLTTIVSSPSSSLSSVGLRVRLADPDRAPAGMVTWRVSVNM